MPAKPIPEDFPRLIHVRVEDRDDSGEALHMLGRSVGDVMYAFGLTEVATYRLVRVRTLKKVAVIKPVVKRKGKKAVK